MIDRYNHHSSLCHNRRRRRCCCCQLILLHPSIIIIIIIIIIISAITVTSPHHHIFLQQEIRRGNIQNNRTKGITITIIIAIITITTIILSSTVDCCYMPVVTYRGGGCRSSSSRYNVYRYSSSNYCPTIVFCHYHHHSNRHLHQQRRNCSIHYYKSVFAITTSTTQYTTTRLYQQHLHHIPSPSWHNRGYQKSRGNRRLSSLSLPSQMSNSLDQSSSSSSITGCSSTNSPTITNPTTTFPTTNILLEEEGEVNPTATTSTAIISHNNRGMKRKPLKLYHPLPPPPPQQQQQSQQQVRKIVTSILHQFVKRITTQPHDDNSLSTSSFPKMEYHHHDKQLLLQLLQNVQQHLIQFLQHPDNVVVVDDPIKAVTPLQPPVSVSSTTTRTTTTTFSSTVPLSFLRYTDSNKTTTDHELTTTTTTDDDDNNMEQILVSSISHLVQQCCTIFCDMAYNSTSKETRMKLRHLASILLLLESSSSSLPVLALPIATAVAASSNMTQQPWSYTVPSCTQQQQQNNNHNHSDDVAIKTDPVTTSLLTLTLILTSLSIQRTYIPSMDIQQQQQLQVCRSAASAIISTMEEYLQEINNPTSQTEMMILRHWVLSILVVHRNVVTTTKTTATNRDGTVSKKTCDEAVHIDFHIITNLARLLGMDNCYCCDTTNMININDSTANSLLSDVVTFAVTNGLPPLRGSRRSNTDLTEGDDPMTSDAIDPIEIDDTEGIDLDSLTTMISFASQFRPWHLIDPIPLIHLAMDHLLWHSAEKICISVTTSHPQWLPQQTTMGIDAVATYIDITIQRRAHRQADKIATAFFEVLAVDARSDLLERYFLNARYLHACNTIVNLIRRGAIPVIERQVDRIDQSVNKIKKCIGTSNSSNVANESVAPSKNDAEPYYEGGTTLGCASTDIRNFVLYKLEESDTIDLAVRFATMWGMNYVMDPEVMKLAEQRRKELYIQWEDLLPHQPTIPDLITTPEALEHAMNVELGTSHNLYGFDVEWGGDDDTGIVGAALLQIATIDNVILVDIPTLSQTKLGVEALERHINTLFHNPNNIIVGFSCREDIVKLRSSPCIRKEQHWFHSDHVVGSSHTVIDLQSIIARLNIEQLPKDHFGLSKVCEYYLMKPLDKTEQCSEWNQRPLSMRQRVYAALDAYVCAVVYSKLMKLDHSTIAVS